MTTDDRPEREAPPPRPFVLEVAEEAAEADPSGAPPVPEAPGADALPGGRAVMTAGRLAALRPRSAASRFALWAFGALISFVLSVAAWDFAATLLQRSPVLGWVAVVLIAAAVLSAAVLALREWAAFARLQRMEGFRSHAAEAMARADLALARRVAGNLSRFYGARPETAWGRAELAERAAEVLDADALLSLAERALLGPLDARAEAEVEAAARQVALVTALVPLALADVAVALWANLRMIRRIAEVYGGRSGSFGSLALLRRVFTSLLATGAVALADDMIGSVAGGGVLSKLSRRFGEGVVNGALTARIGIAAMELCRPLPFVTGKRPAVTALVGRALKGLVRRGGEGG